MKRKRGGEGRKEGRMGEKKKREGRGGREEERNEGPTVDGACAGKVVDVLWLQFSLSAMW